MPWLRQSDTAANHPIVLSALEMEDADDRILNELFGFVLRCATQSAAYEQDYVVTVGTARALAGGVGRYKELAAAAKRCGYWSETTIIVDGEERPAWKLVEDEDLFHMILRAERAWTNQRKKDSRDTDLTVPVRLRDGDACRYCGKTVSWKDRKSGRSATYDHTHPGAAATPETYVVCCRECNGRRQDDPESIWRTLPAPAEPLYGPETTDFLAKYGVDVEPTYTRSETPAPANGTGSGEATVPPASTSGNGSSGRELSPDPDAVEPPARTAENMPGFIPGREATVPPASRAATVPPAARSSPESGSDLGQRSPGSIRVGTGREWIGLEGPGLDGTGRHPGPPAWALDPQRRSRPGRKRRGR